jgi:hypothetical protein
MEKASPIGRGLRVKPFSSQQGRWDQTEQLRPPVLLTVMVAFVTGPMSVI